MGQNVLMTVTSERWKSAIRQVTKTALDHWSSRIDLKTSEMQSYEHSNPDLGLGDAVAGWSLVGVQLFSLKAACTVPPERVHRGWPRGFPYWEHYSGVLSFFLHHDRVVVFRTRHC